VVDWIIAKGYTMRNEGEAELLATDLYNRKAFQCYNNKVAHTFSNDSTTFYRFPEDEPTSDSGETHTKYRFCVLGVDGVGRSSLCRKWSEDPSAGSSSDTEEKSYSKNGLQISGQQGLIDIELLNTAQSSLEASTPAYEAKLARVSV